jgi:hypothetical protein
MLTPSSQQSSNLGRRQRARFAVVVASIQLAAVLVVLGLFQLGASEWFAGSEVLPLVVFPVLAPLLGIEVASRLAQAALSLARVVKTWILVALVSYLFLFFLAATGEMNASPWVVLLGLVCYGVVAFIAAWPGQASPGAPSTAEVQ